MSYESSMWLYENKWNNYCISRENRLAPTKQKVQSERKGATYDHKAGGHPKSAVYHQTTPLVGVQVFDFYSGQ